jgi:hypothetical protein
VHRVHNGIFTGVRAETQAAYDSGAERAGPRPRPRAARRAGPIGAGGLGFGPAVAPPRGVVEVSSELKLRFTTA